MGKYDYLFRIPRQRITTWWMNEVIKALNELHNWITGGTETINVDTVNARLGNFSENVFVQGKVVLKDGDPISINEFSPTAKTQITESIDASKIVSELTHVSATASITANENTNGLEVVLEKGGRPYINVFFSLGGAGELYIEVSLDGENWRQLHKLEFTEASSDIIVDTGIAYPYIRARVPTTGIDVTLEVVASR